jgi:hypothetical protein
MQKDKQNASKQTLKKRATRRRTRRGEKRGGKMRKTANGTKGTMTRE